ncbi:MAG: hypothetical protein Tsb0021_06120 [Chlamydiales bacterium]
MFTKPIKKNKVCLEDYDYQRDTKCFKLLSNLLPFELEVLQEILFSSLRFPISSLAKKVGVDEEELTESLDLFRDAELLENDGVSISVDKERRKYFEVQIERFEPDFSPDVGFITQQLSALPIHVLPEWFAISRSSDHIISSIIERYLGSPKRYENHLLEVGYEHPMIQHVIDEIHQSPSLEISAKKIKENFDLDDDQFAVLSLLLEYNLVAFSVFKLEDDDFIHLFVPYKEWKEFQMKKFACRYCSVPHSIDPPKSEPFEHLICLNHKLKTWENQELSNLECQILLSSKMIKENNGIMERTQKLKDWLQQSHEDQAFTLYRSLPLHFLSAQKINSSERALRLVEKALKRIEVREWVPLNAFIKSMVEISDSHKTVELVRRGGSWHYHIPEIHEETKQFIKSLVLEYFVILGMTETTQTENELHFCLTNFGKKLLNP